MAFREAVGTVITPKYQHTHALGSPIAVTGADKAILERTEYEPFGLVVNGLAKDGPGFTGHVLDAATGMNYMQQRYYDPMLGLFLSVDPVKAYDNPIGQFHRYRYANNNPYRFIDPDGRMVHYRWRDQIGEDSRGPFDNPCGTPICLSAGDGGGGGTKQSRSPEEEHYYAERAKMGGRAEETFGEVGKFAGLFAIREFCLGLVGKIGRLFRVGSHADDVPRSASGLAPLV